MTELTLTKQWKEKVFVNGKEQNSGWIISEYKITSNSRAGELTIRKSEHKDYPIHWTTARKYRGTHNTSEQAIQEILDLY